jgi:ferrous iron transport protein A
VRHAYFASPIANSACGPTIRRKSWSGWKKKLLGGFEMLTLDQVPKGRRCRIQSLDGLAALVQRLLELGLLEGEEIRVVGQAPLGDPIEIECALTRLSLRKSEAAKVRVLLLD